MFFNGNINNMNNMNNMNINPAAYQAFINMMNMNQNYNLDPMTLNNLMIQYMMMNPNFFQMNNPQLNNFQNLNKIQNANFGNLNNQSIIQNGGVMPRPNKFNQSMANNIESFPGNFNKRINIIFETGTGLKINIPTPINVTVNELLLKFANRVGVSESLINQKLFFVVNGGTIKANEKSLVGNYFRNNSGFLNDQMKIIVLDASNVIGAKN